MSSAVPANIPPAQGNKKKNNKKKKANKPQPVDTGAAAPSHDADERSDDPDTPAQIPSPGHADEPSATAGNGHAITNGHSPTVDSSLKDNTSLTTAALDALTKDRDALRIEVETLRKQLESTAINPTEAQPAPSEDSDAVARLKTQLEESEAAKEHAETQYQNLLERVEKIRETLGERLKRDKAELEDARERIDELESQAEAAATAATTRETELQETSRELATLRSRSNLSQTNWHKEKEDLAKQVAHLKRELETANGAMGEWEVIAMEERSVRESLSEKVGDMEEQVIATREAYERAASERDSQAQAVDGLQRALREIQEARKRELREMVEESEQQLQAMKTRMQEADSKADKAEKDREGLQAEVERTAPFEKELKEKNLLIGKLRHEAIILNDHLTKALKYIKKSKPEENVDRQVVTNLFLQFLALDRSDPKKFQVLLVIAGILNWTDEQREQAGLARPGGASNSSLRLPSSPFSRTPSTPSLNTEFFADAAANGPGGGGSGAKGESLAELWAGFLERSVEDKKAESAAGAATSRTNSVSSAATGTGRPDTRG